MIHYNDTFIADEGKVLRVNGKLYKKYAASTDNIEEGKVILVDGIELFVPYKDRDSLITNLIRIKYTLDLELALIANSRLNPNSKEERDFLNWRSYCKYLAKKYE